MEACAVQKVPIARKAAGGTEANRRVRDRRGVPDADGTAAGSAGRNDQAQRPVAADGWLATPSGRAARAASGAEPAAAAAPRATVAGTGPEAERTDAKMDAAQSDRARTQSNDCGAARAQSGAPFSRGSTVGPVPATDSGQATGRQAHTHSSRTPLATGLPANSCTAIQRPATLFQRRRMMRSVLRPEAMSLHTRR